MHRIGISLTAAAMLFLGACVHATNGEPRGKIAVDAALTVTKDASGGFEFRYDAPFADEKGNFDFKQKGAAYKIVNLTFTIADGSVAGLKFRPTGADAIWIVDKRNVGPDGSPTGPYRGKQFSDFRVSADGLQLSLTDLNNDGVLYRYGLRFDLGGALVIDDPDVGNSGGSGGHN